jgi:hypothetical protein
MSFITYWRGKMKAEEREYLRMRYEEDAEHARLHETLRAAVTGLMIALIAGLLAFAVEHKAQWAAGVLVCGTSLIGLLFNHAHNNRYERHLRKLKAFRHKLEVEVSDDIKNVPNDAKSWPSLHGLWLVIYVFTFLIGVVVIKLYDPPIEICSIMATQLASYMNCK